MAGTSTPVEKTDYIVVEQVLGNEEHQLKGIVSLYPNPTQGNVTVAINGEAGNDVSVEVFDMLGRKVSETKGQSIGGSQEININLTAAGSQMFVVRVHVGEKTGSYKLLKKN